MSYTPSTTRASEFQGDLTVWLRSQAGTNDEALERLRKNLTAVIRDELTPKQQEVLQLYYFEGLRMKDIAERLKVNRSTVSRNLMRAQRKLAKYLKYSL